MAAPLMILGQSELIRQADGMADLTLWLICVRILLYGITCVLAEARSVRLFHFASFLQGNRGRCIFYIWVTADLQSSLIMKDQQWLVVLPITMAFLSLAAFFISRVTRNADEKVIESSI